MNKQTIGGLMVVRNEIHRIKECIEHHLPYLDDLIVVDQMSDDGTYEYLQSLEPRITLLRDEIAGYPEPSKQLALKHLSNGWVLYFDADELFPVEFLENMHKIIEANPDIDGFQLRRDNHFDVQVFGDGTPIEPKTVRVLHPHPDHQIRLTRRSLTQFSKQLHVRGRVKRPDGSEHILRLNEYAIFHLKSIKEQWEDDQRYLGPVKYIHAKEEELKNL